MARFAGRVGFILTEDDGTGIWRPKETYRTYYGDLNDYVPRWQAQQNSANQDLTLNNNISILADEFAYEHLDAMTWVEFNGVKWKISSVTISRPRITIFFGGVYVSSEEPEGGCPSVDED